MAKESDIKVELMPIAPRRRRKDQVGYDTRAITCAGKEFKTKWAHKV